MQLVKYLEDILGLEKQRRQASAEYNRKLLGLKYTHTDTGSSTFFDDIDDCHNRLTHFNITVPNHDDLIQHALTAFEASSLHKSDVKEVSKE